MDPDLEKCFVLLNQTLALAEYLSLSIFVGIDGASDRRCWSSNCKNFQFDFMSNELTFNDEDLWLISGRTVGRDIVKKDQFFNLATVTWKDQDSSVSSVARQPLEVKMEEVDPVVDVPSDPSCHKKSLPGSHFASAITTEAKELGRRTKSNDTAKEGVPESAVERSRGRLPEGFTLIEDFVDEETEKALLRVVEDGGERSKKQRTDIEQVQQFKIVSDDVEGSDIATHLDDEPTCPKDDVKVLQSTGSELNSVDPPRSPNDNAFNADQRDQYEEEEDTPSTDVPAREKEQGNAKPRPKRAPHSKCRMCEKVLGSRDERVAHYRKEHCTCKLCGATFKKAVFLRLHFGTMHENLNLYPCPKCGKKFRCRSTMAAHVKRNCAVIVERKQRPCNKCGQRFASKEERASHVRNVHFKCHHCGVTFNHGMALAKHISGVHDKRRHQCPKCDKKFSQLHTIKIHDLAVHQKKKNAVCSTCGKSFPYLSTLNAHVKRLHSNLTPPHSCTLCPMKFFVACRLRVHMDATHHNIRSISCKECDKKFSRLDNLKQHIRYVHSNEKPFACSTCDRKFVSKGHLKRHEITHGKRKEMIGTF